MNPCAKYEKELREAFDVWVEAENRARNLGGDVELLERTQLQDNEAHSAAAPPRGQHWKQHKNTG